MTDGAAPEERRARGALPRWAPLLACLAAVALFFAPALLGSGLFLYRDTGRMHFPHKRFIAEAFSHGRLPEWNPFGGLGFPLVAGGVDAVQHPFNLLLVALPFERGFQAWALLSFAAAAIGAFAWARQLGLGDAAAAAASLGLALAGHLVSSTDNLSYLTALASVPCLLAAAHAFLDRGGIPRAAALAAVSLLAVAAGDPQSWAITVALLPLYAFVVVPPNGRSRRARGVRAAAAVLLCAAAAAPVLVPIAAWLPHSSRSGVLAEIEHRRYGLLPIRLLELALPGLFRPAAAGFWSTLYEAYAGDTYTPLPWVRSEYVGASVLALAALGAARSPRARWLLAGAAVFAWAALGSRSGFGQLAAALPILRGLRYWEKVAFFVSLFAVLAAAHGLDAAVRDRTRIARFSSAALGCAAALLGAYGLSRLAPGLVEGAVARPGFPAESRQLAENLSGGLLHAGVTLAALGAAARAGARGLLSARALGLALAGVVAVDLGTANADAYLLSPRSLLPRASPLADALRAAAPGPPRVVTPFPLDDAGPAPLQPFEWAARRGARTLQSGWNVDLRVANFEPYTGMIPDRAMRFRLRTGTVKQIPQIGIWGFGYAVVPASDPDPGRYGLGPPHDVVAADAETRSLLVRFPHRPRAYLAADVGPTDRRGAMEFVLDPRSVETSRTVVEGDVPPGPRGGGAARIAVDDPERVVVATEAEAPSLLVLNDTHAPGWTATVDGTPARIVPANYLARGVWISAGRHEVEFRYRTPGLASGWAIAAALFAGLGALALPGRRRARAVEGA